VSGCFGIVHMMKIWKFWEHSRCPCCDHGDETKEHLLTCPHPSCSNAWLESLTGLRTWMIGVDTGARYPRLYPANVSNLEPFPIPCNF
jgi:hypothetical protein